MPAKQTKRSTAKTTKTTKTKRKTTARAEEKVANPEVTAKPASEAAATEPKADAAPKATAAPKPKAAPKAKAAATSKAAPAPKAKPKPTAAPKPEAAKAKATAAPKPEPKPEVVPETKPAPQPEPKAAPEPKPTPEPKPASEPKAKAAPVAALKPKPEPKPEATPEAKPAPQPEPKAAPQPEATPEAKPAPQPEPKAAPEPKPVAAPEPKPAPKAAPAAAPKPASEPKPEPEPVATTPEPEPAPEPELPQPRRSVAFIGSECYPFVKTGGLGDVMYALPKALVALNCDVRVILPKYACIKQEHKDKMVYRGAFDMDLCSDGRRFYVGIMEYVWDGVVYDFIDNEEFFSKGNPYTNLVDDIPTFCFFGKAALSALNYMDWIPDVIHCHDWQAGLVPVYLRTMFAETPLARSKVVTTIHNLRFQGVYDIPTIQYWSNLPQEVFNMGALQQEWTEANMLKGGISYSDMITTVSGTYAGEIQTWEYGEGLDAHLRYHSHKLRGIVNGIDYDMWDPATDRLLEAPYDASNAIGQKRANKLALQRELGLEQDEGKFVIGLISRLTNQKGLDLVSAIVPGLIDGNTQIVVLGTGDAEYEDAFRFYENEYRGQVCANIMYDEGRAHKIYAGSDVLLVPSKFEPCGLTQLIAMHYGTVPVVRETGGLKDTVQPYNAYENDGNGFTFDRYEADLLYDAINRAKTLYFEDRESWDKMVQRDMEKDVSWANSAQQYRGLYLELTP